MLNLFTQLKLKAFCNNPLQFDNFNYKRFGIILKLVLSKKKFKIQK